jgi:hypothetical protein
MIISVRYESRRSEVWQWYWRTWRRSLWRFHLAIFLLISSTATSLMYGKVPSTVAGYILIIAIGLIPLIGFALWPMIKFKPQTRTLTVNESGIETSIGDKNVKVGWDEFTYFKREASLIVIQRRNLNSFLVPSRAFKTENDEEEFQSFVSKKINESGVSRPN